MYFKHFIQFINEPIIVSLILSLSDVVVTRFTKLSLIVWSDYSKRYGSIFVIHGRLPCFVHVAARRSLRSCVVFSLLRIVIRILAKSKVCTQ